MSALQLRNTYVSFTLQYLDPRAASVLEHVSWHHQLACRMVVLPCIGLAVTPIFVIAKDLKGVNYNKKDVCKSLLRYFEKLLFHFI